MERMVTPDGTHFTALDTRWDWMAPAMTPDGTHFTARTAVGPGRNAR